MQYREMGSLDWEVSALGMGCMRLPTRRINRMRVDTEASIALIRRAIDLGVNYFDTAWPYHMGDSETVLGQALQDGLRGQVKVVTKLFMPLVRSADDFDNYLDRQLAKLQTDHVDIYLFHMLNTANFDKVKQYGLVEKMLEAQRQGRIRHIGFSFHDTLPVFKEIVDFYDWDMAQIQYNYMDTGIQATTTGLEYAASKGIAVTIMEPLKGGALANPPAEARAIMRETGIERTPVDWALQWLWNRPEVAVVLSGMSNMRQLEENALSAQSSGVGSLTGHEREAIDRIAQVYRDKTLVPCTACEYCMPCPAGVNIPKNFAILNGVSMESQAMMRMMTRRGYRRLARKREDVDKENPNGAASLCVRCGKCLEHCPQGIAIPDELVKVDAILGKHQRISRHYPR